MNVFVPNSFPVYPLAFLGGRSLRGSLRRSHVEDAPKCIFSAAPSTSHHFAVGTMTRPRLFHRPTWEFSSAVSLAKPLRAATAFSRSDSSSHFPKDGVNLSIQLMLVPPACSEQLLLRKPHLVVLRGTGFAAAESIVLLTC